MLDMTLPVASESWNVYQDLIFKLGATSTSTTTPVTSGAYFDQSDMSVRFNFDMSGLGVVMFNDGTTVPTNKDRWLVIQAVSANGTTSVGSIPAEVHYTGQYEYTDL